MGTRVALTLVVVIAALTAVHAATPGFVLRDGFPVVFDTGITAIEAADYRCGAYSALLVSTTRKVLMFNSSGVELGSYTFTAPVHALSYVRTSMYSCSGVAGAWNGRVYSFFLPRGERNIDSYGKRWVFDVGERIYSLHSADFDGDGYEDVVLVGTGSYADESFGNLYLLPAGYPGNYTWKYSTSSRVRAIAVLDLMGDMVRNDIAVGYGRRIDVLNSNASLVWRYDAAAEVRALSHADLDGDGAADDLLAGIADTLVALDSHRNEVWSLSLDGKVNGIVPVDRDGNGVIDYYLVAAGTVIYAVDDGNISWSFDTGVEIDALVAADFDGDGIREDVAIVSEGRLIAYDYALLRLPELELEKNAALENGSVKISLKLTNRGDGTALDVVLEDSVPANWTLLSGSSSWRGALPPGRKVAISYLLAPPSAGNHTLPEASVSYSDSYGGIHSLNSSMVEVSIPRKEKEEERQDNSTAASPPVITAEWYAEGNLTRGGNVTITVLLRNLGGSTAFVSFSFEVPQGVMLNISSWSGSVEAGKVVLTSFLLMERGLNSSTTEVVLPALDIIYRDESGGTYTTSLEELRIPVSIPGESLLTRLKAKTKILPALLLPVLILLVLKRKGKLRIRIPHRLRPPGLPAGLPVKLPWRKKRATSPEELERLEREFVRTYIEYQRRGERPTYGEMMEKLGVDLETVKEVVERIRRSGKYTL